MHSIHIILFILLFRVNRCNSKCVFFVVCGMLCIISNSCEIRPRYTEKLIPVHFNPNIISINICKKRTGVFICFTIPGKHILTHIYIYASICGWDVALFISGGISLQGRDFVSVRMGWWDQYYDDYGKETILPDKLLWCCHNICWAMKRQHNWHSSYRASL